MTLGELVELAKKKYSEKDWKDLNLFCYDSGQGTNQYVECVSIEIDLLENEDNPKIILS